ncbi:hypothetical protein DITRI_Ditri03aG0180800 [Diplodiscus trichospermus]
MATRTTVSKPARQLGELLQEQQEPFILEVYLSERGCLRRNLNSGANFFGCHGYSGKFLKKFGSQNQSKKGIPHLPKVLKVAPCNKFFTIKGSRTKNSDDEDGKLGVTEMDRYNQENAEPDRFSSASSTTVYNSCSDRDLDEPSMSADNFKSNLKLYNEREKKAAADAKFQWSCMEEDSKQHNPQSLLEEMYTSTGTQPDNRRLKFITNTDELKTARRVSRTRQKNFLLPKLITEDSIFSASLWNSLLQNRPEESSCGGLTEQQRGPDQSNSSAFSIPRRVLQQTKRFLFDCVRELAENNHSKQLLGSEEIGKVMCEKMKGWGDESNIWEWFDFSQGHEWKDYESEKRDIGLVIGNAIVEEITTEAVMDMIYF